MGAADRTALREGALVGEIHVSMHGHAHEDLPAFDILDVIPQ